MVMESKIQTALKTVIKALKNDTIHYDWHEQSNCNCGLVAQALLSDSEIDFKSNINKWKRDVKSYDSKLGTSWKNAIKYLCPVTGLTSYDIFNELFKRGLTREDIIHLEYMENEAILKRSGIVKNITKTRIVKHSNKYKAFFGIKQIETYQKIDQDYYRSKENLILYLSAWLEIISEKSVTDIKVLNKVSLEEELLKAVSLEDYSRAAEIRDMLFEVSI